MAKKLDMVEELRGTPYAAVRKLAEGGMGEVHVVLRPPAPTEQVMKIVKLVDPSAQTDIAKRTLAEGRALRALIHPNIVELLDLGLTAQGRAFLVTELLRGHTLKEEVDKRGPLPIDEVIDIVGQILSGLDTAHSRGLVHRDLKPLNVFCCDAGSDGRRTAKILDFGIAKAISEEARARAGSALVATREGYFVGSPAFMAPEQGFAGQIDARTDIYALGALTYYLLTGRVVFNELSAEQVLQAHFFKAPDAPSLHRPEIPQAVDELVLRALAKDPANRFKSALEMQRALLQLGFRTRPASVPPVRSFHAVGPLPAQPPRALEPQRPAVACVRHPSAADADTQLLQLAPSSQPAAQAKRPPVRVATIPAASPQHTPPTAASPTRAEQRLERLLWLTVGFLAVLVLVLSAMLLVPRLLVGSLPTPLGFPPLVAERTALMSSSLLASDTLPNSVIERLRSGAYPSLETEPTAPAAIAGASGGLSEPERIGRLVQPRKADEGSLKVPPKHADADDFSPGETFRGYVVSGHFSSGGLSHLYRCTNRLGAEFLVKVLKRSYRLDAFRSIQEKLVAEGQLLHSVRGRSPFLVSVHDVGIDSKVGPYVIMDKLEGNSLDVRLLAHRASGVTYEAQKAVRLGVLICDGLHSMHELGAVHRDIKPANIFIQELRERAMSQVVLIDWGAAKSPYSPNTSLEPAALGTAAYMAPEQIQRGPITGAIDQYALAHVLLEMIFRHAFTGENARVQAFQLVQMQIGVIPDAPPEYFVPPRLWAILNRALAKNYRERFPSCRAFGHELRAWLDKPDLVTKKPAVLEQMIRPTVPKTGAEARVRTPAAPPTEVPTPAKRLAPGDLSKEPSLYVRNGKNAGARYEIHGRHVIGRHPGYAHIVLDDEGISNKHAVIEAVVFEPPVFNVQDLGSSNGTAVGGIRLSDGESEDNLALVAPLTAGESFVLDSIELLLLAPGRLLPGERWQSLEEAAAEERARLARKVPAKGGTVKMVQPERTPAPAIRKITQQPQVDVATKWLAPTLLVIERASVTRFHLGDTGVIGASPDRANILIEDSRVSGGHLRYTKVTGDIGSSITYLFEDLQSLNGTFSDEDGTRKPVQAHALRSLRSIWIGGFIQLVLLPPGHFAKPGEYVPCDLSGRPISIQNKPSARADAPIRLRVPLIILTVALAVAALCWYAFHRLGWL